MYSKYLVNIGFNERIVLRRTLRDPAALNLSWKAEW